MLPFTHMLSFWKMIKIKLCLSLIMLSYLPVQDDLTPNALLMPYEELAYITHLSLKVFVVLMQVLQDLYCFLFQFSSVQLLSRVQLFAAPWTAARQASLSITNPQSLLKFMSIELVMPSNHLILCCPLLLLPLIFSNIRVFSKESVLHIRQPKYWSFSFNISPSNEYLGLTFFRIDWLDLLAVQGTLKSLLRHHNSKASVFGTQLSLQSNSHVYI